MSTSGPKSFQPYYSLCQSGLEENLLKLTDCEWVTFTNKPDQIYMTPKLNFSFDDMVQALKQIVFGTYHHDCVASCFRISRMANHVEIYPQFKLVLEQGLLRATTAQQQLQQRDIDRGFGIHRR